MQTTPYYVCHVDGTVTRKENIKETIKVGNKIMGTDAFYFSTGARLLVISNKGFFEIADRKPLPRQTLANVLLVVQDHILPNTRIAQIHTRGSGGALLNLQAMQDYLMSLSDDGKPRLLLVRDIRLYLNKQTFTKRDQNYFFLRCMYKGETIRQKLPFIEPKRSDDMLYVQISKDIFLKNNAPLDTAAVKNIQLYYQYDDVPEPVLISDLAITIASREDILDELKVVIRQQSEINATSEVKKDALQELIAGYLLSSYGWTDKEALSSLFPELFN